jgi:hypothetical protein
MNLGGMVRDFMSLIELMQDSPTFAGYFTNLEPKLEANGKGIKDNFGLLSNQSWWRLVFRTTDGRGAYIFIDFVKKEDWDENNRGKLRKKIRKFIMRHEWYLNPPEQSDNTSTRGTGPWIPDDDPYGGGGDPGGGGGPT